MIFLIFFVIITYSEKCWYLKDKLKISCGNHFYSDKFYVNWNYKNTKIADSLNKFCVDCNFYELNFELEKTDVYKIEYTVDGIIKISKTNQILFEDYSTYGCFSCFKELYKN